MQIAMPENSTILAHLAAAPDPDAARVGLLFHGTLEPLVGPLRGGGYDGIFWTTEGEPMTAQTYIPSSGSSILLTFHDFQLADPVRPSLHSGIMDVVLHAMGREMPDGVERDHRGQATSWPIPEGWPTNGEVRRFIMDEFGYRPNDLGSFELRTMHQDGALRFLHSGEREVGSLVILKPLEDLKVFDYAAGRESDISQPDYHRHDLYEWRRCTVPLFRIVGGELDSTVVMHGETPEEAAERFQRVRDWFAEAGGAAKALEQSPVILVADAQGIVLLDGWHRIVVAHEEGLTDIPAFVGISTTPICEFRRGGPLEGVELRNDVPHPDALAAAP